MITVVIESDYVIRPTIMYLSALNMPSDWFFIVLVTCQSADKDRQESRAVAEKPHDAVVKFDALEFPAASRGPACDSTALLFSLGSYVLVVHEVYINTVTHLCFVLYQQTSSPQKAGDDTICKKLNVHSYKSAKSSPLRKQTSPISTNGLCYLYQSIIY